MTGRRRISQVGVAVIAASVLWMFPSGAQGAVSTRGSGAEPGTIWPMFGHDGLRRGPWSTPT